MKNQRVQVHSMHPDLASLNFVLEDESFDEVTTQKIPVETDENTVNKNLTRWSTPTKMPRSGNLEIYFCTFYLS